MWTSTASRKPSPTLEQRLLAGLKEDPSTGCWMWARGTGTHGRGVIRFNSDKMVTVPRAAGFVWLGVPIEGDGEVVVCHKCDQPLCGRPHPDHLYVGDYARNELDAYERGQRLMKLTDDDVLAIKILYRQGKQSQRSIARQFDVTQQHISNIIRGNRR